MIGTVADLVRMYRATVGKLLRVGARRVDPARDETGRARAARRRHEETLSLIESELSIRGDDALVRLLRIERRHREAAERTGAEHSHAQAKDFRALVNGYLSKGDLW